MKKSINLLIIFFALSGCNNSEAVQTVDWYKLHDTEMKNMITKCKNNPGELMSTANCINATTANNQKENARRGWTQPEPIDFSK